MTADSYETALRLAVEALELPDSSYEKAINRYKDLGEWFGRPESTIEANDPHVFAQGSFALGTAIRPLLEGESYDLDLACKLRTGVSKATHSQYDLKQLLGKELESYREARRISNPLEQKHRCWRLEYRDDLSFHMDVVPCIPTDTNLKQQLRTILESRGMNEALASTVADDSVNITDDRLPTYRLKDDDWHVSNPEGYVEWFESRQRAEGLLTLAEARAQVDEVPLYRRKTNLQRCIQLLKRHRDLMFKDEPDSKPISIIITTIAARAYSGNPSLAGAMEEVLRGLSEFRTSNSNEVPNPANPNENFADRWQTDEGRRLRLKENFQDWVRQAAIDIPRLGNLANSADLSEQLKDKLNVQYSATTLESQVGLLATAAKFQAPHVHIPQDAPSPWSQN
nr:nucleotidyltransferase [Pseudomonas sp. A46]